jgi:F-type H+-transporting ATPase subunit gamma
MEELERLKRKIKNARDLQSVVKIMKTISASNIREYEQAVESLIEYNKTIEMGFQILMQNRKELLTVKPVEEKNRLGTVIFGSDQGLCGSFNEQIATFAIDKMNEIEHEERRALAVGERVIARLEEAGQPIETHFSFFGGHLDITQMMLDVLIKIEECQTQLSALIWLTSFRLI